MKPARIRVLAVAGAIFAGAVPPVVGMPLDGVEAGLTYQRGDGNRIVEGRGNLPGGEFVDIALGQAVRWIVGVPVGDGSLWVATVADGSLTGIALRGGQARRIPNFIPGRLEGPPVLLRLGRQVSVLAPATHGSPLSHPVPIARQQRLAYISDRGLLSVASFYGSQRLGLGVRLPMDARILADEKGRLLMLSDPTTRYGHGALGDEEEAGSMTLVDAAGAPRIRQRFIFPEPVVFEGVAPLWVDWNGDGEREIVATLSSQEKGAQIVLFAEEGKRIAASAPLGTAKRWRHAIAVAGFGPTGETELAEVVTPHREPTVQFLAWRGDQLQPTATLRGFTSHVNGSRNLDQAAAGDFDGDGRIELLLSDVRFRSLGGIRRTAGGAEVAWSVPLPAPLSSNIGCVVMANRTIVLAVGLAEGTVRFWGAR